MTKREEQLLVRGVAAGTLMGMAIGPMLALAILIKPELFAVLVR